jgi:hypothetical protein
MRDRTVAAVLALSLSSAVVARAEQVDGGGRVRLALQTPDGRRLSGQLVGQLVASGPDTLTVMADGREVVVKRAEVRRVDYSLGRRSRGSNALRGAAIGLVIGAAMGAGIGAMDGDDPDPVLRCPPNDDFGLGSPCGPLLTFSARDKAVMGGTVLGALGLALGGLTGAAVAPGERWRRAEEPSFALQPQRDGLGLQVTIAF